MVEIIYVIGFAGWLLAALKWADWRRFTEFRATIYVMLVGDFLYNHLTESRHLWTYESPSLHLAHNLMNATVAICIYPLVVMIFLSRYPDNGRIKQILYNLLFSSIFISHEWLADWLGVFEHHRNWGFGWSLFLDLIIFPFLRLHQKRPLWGVIAFILFTLMFCLLFKLPVVFEQSAP
ncbi:hypothetical protein GE107_21305 [Cohnella sp. CFH 77786]|uniref:CBO0543 family protein n=1 Tax=Cohnella sp. CFH 77786 TaxID=2662265 RepID=UPI001C60F9E2|nr:CBO0543 family protein [Cohnella sp. CFH 77786]MBW5448589.1 hypothetical protein [Cohnella sp. CFH 77786]